MRALLALVDLGKQKLKPRKEDVKMILSFLYILTNKIKEDRVGGMGMGSKTELAS